MEIQVLPNIPDNYRQGLGVPSQHHLVEHIQRIAPARTGTLGWELKSHLLDEVAV